MNYTLKTTYSQQRVRQTPFMFRHACLWLFCLACCAAGATDVHFDLDKFNASPVGGRTVLLQPLQPMPGNLITNVSDDDGTFTFSNAKVADYVVSIRALGGAAKIDFQITVTATNLGTVEADTITSQLGIQTYPTGGKSSWTIQSADQRYQFSGIILSNTFYPLFSNPSNYITTDSLPTNFWSPTASLWISNLVAIGGFNTNQYAAGTLMTASTNSAGLVTFVALSQTNGFTSIVSSNAALFAGTNLVFVTSNALSGQIGSAGISAITATNIATNQVYGGTNVIGISSGLSAYVSTNRFEISGAGPSAATNINNALSGVIGTNGTSLVYKFSTTGTNVINNIATNNFPTNGFFGTAVGSGFPGVQIGLGALAGGTAPGVAVGNGAIATNSGVAIGRAAIGNDNGVTIGDGANGSFDGTAVGQSANATEHGAALGEGATATSGGTALGELSMGDIGGFAGGSGANATNQGVAIGANADGHNPGNVAIGTYDAGLVFLPAIVPEGWTYTIELGAGTAVLQGGLNFRGYGIVTTNGIHIGNGGGLTNTWSTNLIGTALNQVTNIANTQAAVASNALSQLSITNAYGTNRVTVLFTGQRLYIPTNFDAAGGSNFLFGLNATTSNGLQGQIVAGGVSASTATNIAQFQVNIASNSLSANKLDKTNGFAVELVASNTTLQGNVSFGDGNSVILSSGTISINGGATELDSDGTAFLGNGNVTIDSTGLISGNGGGVSNTWSTNLTGTALTQVTNIAAFKIGVSNAVLFANKLDKTNGTAYGLTSTNTTLQGNVSFGFTGQDTNFISTTNVVGFINAGTSLTTNGAFVWITSQNNYTNWNTGAILTNNGSAWLLETNGVSLYSLATVSPFGVYSAVSGSGTPLGFPGWVFRHDGMLDVGFWSVTNFNVISNSIVTNTITISANNAIANLNGNGTNTFLTNSTLAWYTPLLNQTSAGGGGLMNFQSMSAGVAQTNIGVGLGAAILSGATNKIQLSGASVIAGGMWNIIGGGGNNFNAIVGGFSNAIAPTGVDGSFIGGGIYNTVVSFYSSIVGGRYNKINTSVSESVIIGGDYNTNSAGYGVILGGLSNLNSGTLSMAAGSNARATNDNSFVWSDGAVIGARTNASFIIQSSNGVAINTNFPAGFALNVNGTINATAFTVAGTSAGVAILNSFTTNTDAGAKQIVTNILNGAVVSSALIETNFVLNTVYTNTLGTPVLLRAATSLTTAAVAGASEMDLMVDQTQSGTFVLKGSAKLLTSIAAALAGTSQFDITGVATNNAIYYWTNSSAGAGDSSSLVSGSGQISKLP